MKCTKECFTVQLCYSPVGIEDDGLRDDDRLLFTMRFNSDVLHCIRLCFLRLQVVQPYEICLIFKWRFVP